MSGRHIAGRHRQLVPLIAGVVAAVALVGGAVATVNLKSDSKPTAADKPIDVVRTTDARADRGERPSPTSSPTVEVTSAQPTASPTKSSVKPSTSKKPSTSPAAVSGSGSCKVSYYDTGSTTANGEKFNPNGLTAAHKSWKFGTKVRVTNIANGKSVEVRINDRGPYVGSRCIDLARGAFVVIASTGTGVINARYEVLK